MRKIILFGAASLVLSLGAVNAYAMGGGNLSPEASPYAIIAPQTLGPSWTNEGRAVYTGHDGGYGNYGAQPGYAAPAANPDGAAHHKRRQY
jgi:hypothetical protein